MINVRKQPNDFTKIQFRYPTLLQMLRQTYIISIFIFFLFVLQVRSSFNWTANQKYSYAGKFSVDINSLATQYNSTDWTTPVIVTIPFPRAYSGSFGFNAVTVLSEYECDNLSKGINFFVSTRSVSVTYLQIAIETPLANYIQKLSVSYLLVDVSLVDINNVQQYRIHVNQNSGLISINNDPFNYYLGTITLYPFNLTGGAKSIPIISGLVAYPSSTSTTIDLEIAASFLDSRTLLLQISSHSNEFTLLQEMYVEILIYNTDYMEKISTAYRLYDGHLTISNSSYSLYESIDHEIATCNTIIGLSSFSISNKDKFNFFHQISQNSSLSGKSDFILQMFTFQFGTIYSQYCHYKTPYFEPSQGMCYSKCPLKTKQQINKLECVCYDSDGISLLANQKCLISDDNTTNTKANKSSIGQSLNKQQEIGTNIIIAISISSFTFIVLLILIINCIFKRKRQGKRQQNNALQDFGEVIVQCKFDNNQQSFDSLKKDSQHSHQSVKIKINNIGLQVQPQIYHPIQDIKQIQKNNCGEKKQNDNNQQAQGKKQEQKKNQQISQPVFHATDASNINKLKEYQKIQSLSCGKNNPHLPQHWVPCPKFDGSNMCTICRNSQTYLQTQCGHYFHAQCLTKWMEKNAICPNCNLSITNKFKYYCNRCGEKQRDTNFTKPSEVISAKLVCDECTDIPV